MNYLEKVENLHPDIINDFIMTGKSTAIPADLQHIILQMVWGIEIYQGERNITRAARKLQARTAATLNVKIDVSTAKSRLYAALNYFDADSNVSETVWLRDYANKFEDLAKYAIAKGNLGVAERCYDKAKESRLRAVAADKQASLGVIYILTGEPEEYGAEKRNLKGIARKANEGYYSQLISGLPIPDKEKKRLMIDADIVEEIIDDDEE